MICKHAPRVLSLAFAFFQNKKDRNLGCPLGKAASSESREAWQRVVSTSAWGGGWGGTDGRPLGGLAAWPAVSEVGVRGWPPTAQPNLAARRPASLGVSRRALGWELRVQRARSEAGGCGKRKAWLFSADKYLQARPSPPLGRRRTLTVDFSNGKF